MILGCIIAGLAIVYLAYKEWLWNKRWNELQKRYMNVLDALFVNTTNDNGYDKQYQLKLLMAMNQNAPVTPQVSEGDLLEQLVKKREEGEPDLKPFLNQPRHMPNTSIKPKAG